MGETSTLFQSYGKCHNGVNRGCYGGTEEDYLTQAGEGASTGQ